MNESNKADKKEEKKMLTDEKVNLDCDLTFMEMDVARARLMIVDVLSDHFDKDEPNMETIFGIQAEYSRIQTKLEIAEDYLLQISSKIHELSDTYIKDFTR